LRGLLGAIFSHAGTQRGSASDARERRAPSCLLRIRNPAPLRGLPRSGRGMQAAVLQTSCCAGRAPRRNIGVIYKERIGGSMFSLTRTGFLFAAACCGFSSIAHAEDVYRGKATVQSEGRNAAGCVPGPVKVTVANGHFAYGTSGAPVATGAVASDGSFSGSFVNSAGPRGVVQLNVSITGHIQGRKISGSTSTSSGCVRNFTLTKQ